MLFLDSGVLREIKEIAGAQLVSGVTTNPKILSGTDYDSMETAISSICHACYPLAVSVEILDPYQNIDNLLEEARAYHSISPASVVIKVPLIGTESIKLINLLHDINIPTNVTCLMSAYQVQLVTQPEPPPRYVSLFYRRMLDYAGKDYALTQITRARNYIDVQRYFDEPPLIIAGSIRQVEDVPDCFAAGADIVTVPYPILTQMFSHPKTTEAINEFTSAWRDRQR